MTKTSLQDQLTSCDKEQIRFISSVQAHGYLLAFKPADQKIVLFSENLLPMVEGTKTLLGLKVGLFFSPADLENIMAEAKLVLESPDRFTYLKVSPAGGARAEALIHSLGQGLVALEWEYRESEVATNATVSQSQLRARAFVEQLHFKKNLEEAGRLLCRQIRDAIGFDRVMLYKFLPNWEGEVLAEDKNSEAHSFYRHRFPATDIPLPARELYLKNRSRLIFDSDSKAVALQPSVNPLDGTPWDLSTSKVRAVSVIHLEYLRNMGVKCSFSVAVIVDNKLWGLVACHSKESISIPHYIRLECETLASTFAVAAAMMEKSISQEGRVEFDRHMRSLIQTIKSKSNPVEYFFKQDHEVNELFKSTGYAFVHPKGVEIAGLTPPIDYIKELISKLAPQFGSKGQLTARIDSLAALDPKWAELASITCGVIAAPVSSFGDSFFLIFRPEMLQTVNWGGDPRKTMEKRGYEGVINPRKSFESWSETVRHQSEPWKDYEVEGANYLRDLVFDTFAQKEQLMRELSDRLKSTSAKA